MKALKIIANIFKWIIIILIVLFSVATFMGKSYGQTIMLILIAATLIYWPVVIKEKWNKKISFLIRVVSVLFLFLMMKFIFKSEPKQSIYKNENYKSELYRIYEEKLLDWPKETTDKYIETKYGKVHLLICGSLDQKPLVMIHAASMGAHSWAENLEPLLNDYCIYSFDNIGEANKSELNDALSFPKTEQEIADLYSSLFDSLNIESAPVFGASNGGFIAQCLAYYHPEKVEKLALFGPMGLTQLTGGSIFMLSAASLYPFQFVRDEVTKWALGEDKYCLQKYGDWFNCMMKGTIPSVAQPIPMTKEQKHEMRMPVLLFLGTKDRIVGDVEIAKKAGEEYPNIQIEIRESGHLIAVEHRDFVNQKIAEFLSSN